MFEDIVGKKPVITDEKKRLYQGGMPPMLFDRRIFGY